MAITTNVLSKLVKRYGPNMGRVVHAVAEETGLAASKVSKLIKSAGPLKSEFDFKTIFHHGTPKGTMSRTAASLGQDAAKPIDRHAPGLSTAKPHFWKSSRIGRKQLDRYRYEDFYAPFEELAPSRGGAFGPGTYLSRNPFWSQEMAVRKGDPRMISRNSPRGPNEPSIVPYVLKKGWKGRFVGNSDYTDQLGSNQQKLFNVTPIGRGGERWKTGVDGWPVSPLPPLTKRELKKMDDDYKRFIPEKRTRESLELKMKAGWNPRGEKLYDQWGSLDDIEKASKARSTVNDFIKRVSIKATEKSLRKRGKIGVYKPGDNYWPEEHVIFPGLEKEWVRHPLARFQKRIGGTFASLLPLISMLRGKREE